jgi:hypothetical protein
MPDLDESSTDKRISKLDRPSSEAAPFDANETDRFGWRAEDGAPSHDPHFVADIEGGATG